MLSELSGQLRSEIPTALFHPIDARETCRLVLHRIGEEVPMFEKFAAQRPESFVSFPFSEIDGLSQQEFLELETVLAQAVRKNFDQWDKPVPNGIEKFIKPEDGQNVLRLALQYPKTAPKESRLSAFVYLSFTYLYETPCVIGEPMFLEGTVFFPEMVNWTSRERAIFSTNPDWLSMFDIMQAYHFARETGDPVFVAEIERLVNSKHRII